MSWRHGDASHRRRHRRRLVRHRRRQGAARARRPVHVLRGLRPRRRQLGLRQPQRDVGGLPRAAHQHLARPDGVLGLPDAEVLSGLPAPHPDRRVLRRLRRPLRLPRPRSASRPRSSTPRGRRRRLGAELDDGSVERFDALLVANGHHWDPRWPEPMFPGHDTFTGTQMHAHDYRDSDIFAGKRASSSGWATARWTSRSSPPTSPSAPSSPPAAGRGSCPSTCSAARSTSCRTTRGSRSSSASG